MDVSRIQPGRGLGNDNSMPAGFDLKQIFFTNLQLLGFDAAAMEIKYKIPFNKWDSMFSLYFFTSSYSLSDSMMKSGVQN